MKDVFDSMLDAYFEDFDDDDEQSPDGFWEKVDREYDKTKDERMDEGDDKSR